MLKYTPGRVYFSLPRILWGVQPPYIRHKQACVFDIFQRILHTSKYTRFNIRARSIRTSTAVVFDRDEREKERKRKKNHFPEGRKAGTLNNSWSAFFFVPAQRKARRLPPVLLLRVRRTEPLIEYEKSDSRDTGTPRVGIRNFFQCVEK